MGENNTDHLARNIVKRANALNISIARLCRDAGVPRKWFERFKRRTPSSVESYIKIESQLLKLEKEQAIQARVAFICPRTLERRTGVIKQHNGIQYIFCPETSDSYPVSAVIDLQYITQ